MPSPPVSPELRARFLEYNKQFRISNSRIGCLLVVVLMPVGLSLDWAVYPEEVGFFFFLRILCSLLALVVWWALSSSFGKKHYRALGMMWFMLPSFFISIMIYVTEGVASPYYAGLNLVLVAVSWVAQVTFMESLMAAFLNLVMYACACMGHGPLDFSLLFNNLYFLVLTGIIVVTGSFFLNRLRFREYALRQELDQSRRELESSNEKLIELDRAKSNFFANISHELRTPLTLLIGPLDRLRGMKEGGAVAEREEMLDIMYQNAMRLLRLINDLLTLVRMDSGRLDLRPVKVELAPYLEGICRSVSAMAREKGLRFSWSVDDGGIHEGTLDRDKVEKIFLNLLFNSFKFTPQGGAVDFIARREGNTLHAVVKDTGKGISPEELPHVFDRFWQAESASNRSFQGVGLGLAMVKDLAQLHGGKVTAASELGKGTAMTVDLDISQAPMPAVEDQPDQDAGTNNNPEWVEQLYRRAEFFPAHVRKNTEERKAVEAEDGRPCILVADDEPEMMRFLRSQLRGKFRIHEAEDGLKALELARDNRYQLILLDFMMPGVDGVEVTRRLREMSQHRSVPVIILTARADEDSKIQALEAGATDFLTKPFASTELQVRCRNLASAHELQLRLEEEACRLEDALLQIKLTETQMVQQAKMASLGQLSAGLLHEINNPLNFATTALFLVKKRMSQPDWSPESVVKPMEDLQDGIRRVAGIVSSLRDFTHPDTKQFSHVLLGEVIRQSVTFVQIRREEIGLEIDVAEDLGISGNMNQLIHLFINLFQNAVDSLREKNAEVRNIKVRGGRRGDRILVEVEDNGVGMDDLVRQRIFEAFFTTKEVGQGVGLGLSICHRIVEQHGGRISVESAKGEWCRFAIDFPAAVLKK